MRCSQNERGSNPSFFRFSLAFMSGSEELRAAALNPYVCGGESSASGPFVLGGMKYGEVGSRNAACNSCVPKHCDGMSSCYARTHINRHWFGTTCYASQSLQWHKQYASSTQRKHVTQNIILDDDRLDFMIHSWLWNTWPKQPIRPLAIQILCACVTRLITNHAHWRISA